MISRFFIYKTVIASGWCVILAYILGSIVLATAANPPTAPPKTSDNKSSLQSQRACPAWINEMYLTNRIIKCGRHSGACRYGCGCPHYWPTVPEDINSKNSTETNLDDDWMKNTFEILLPVVLYSGMIGNFFSIVVLRSPLMRSPVSVHLLTLSILDSILLILCHILFFERIYTADPTKLPFNIRMVFYPIALMCQTAGIWVTVCLTAERYIAICFPFKASLLSSIFKARITVIACVIASFVYNVPRYLELSDNLKSEFFFRLYYSYFYAIFMFVTPLIAICSMNFMLIRTLKHARRSISQLNAQICHNNRDHCVNSANLSQAEKINIQRNSSIIRADKNMTRLVIFVVGAFMICQSPAMVYNAALGYFGNRQDMMRYKILQSLSDLRNLLVTCNSCVNFAIYCLMGAKFRRTFLHVILPCIERRKYKPSRHGTMIYSLKSPRSRVDENSHMQILPSSTNGDKSPKKVNIVPIRCHGNISHKCNNIVCISKTYPDTL